ncbi:hypothetical protein CRUP_035183 [Coryphaenoides rupestris]|nr:hypothetical protein CRUP_035183 [Coryphaenoides rupestris]
MYSVLFPDIRKQQDRDTERQRVDELLEMNMSLEAELKRSSHARRHLLQSEGESDEERYDDAIDLKPLSVEVGEASTLMLVGAEQENAELRRRLEDLQAQREVRGAEGVLQSEGLAMEEELCRLRSHQELHAMQSSVIAGLEGERASLEREREALRGSVESLRAAQRKGDQLELMSQTLKAELERQGRSLEASRRREAELETELREAALEAEGLARGRDQALLEASRLEQEKEACVTELEGRQKEGRQREREAGRLRQQLESTTLALEHGNQRARELETEHRGLSSEVDLLNQKVTRVEDELRTTSEALSRSRESAQLPPRFVEGSDRAVDLEERAAVTPNIRPCMQDEHRCGDGSCILLEYRCDNRPDCRDMSDEMDCGEFSGGFVD